MLTNITMGAQATATVLAMVPDYNMVYSQGLTNDKKVGLSLSWQKQSPKSEQTTKHFQTTALFVHSCLLNLILVAKYSDNSLSIDRKAINACFPL